MNTSSHFRSLNKKRIAENCKMFSSQKVRSSEKIKFTEEFDSLIGNEDKVVIKLNDFFSNALIDLNTSNFLNVDPLSGSINYFKLKAKE